MTREQARHHPAHHNFRTRVTEYRGAKRVTWALGWDGRAIGQGACATVPEAQAAIDRVLAEREER
jgi:hypothetical protein